MALVVCHNDFYVCSFRVLDVAIELHLDSYIFLHHPGEFTSTDTKTKIPGTIAVGLYIDICHDVLNEHYLSH